MLIYPPNDEQCLLERMNKLAGLSIGQLASVLNVSLPVLLGERKGYAGQLIERALGATAGNRARPDFDKLGIELKTIPLNAKGEPAESTFITHIPLLTIHHQSFETSTCYEKLRRVLWVPIEAEKTIPYAERRIGQGLMWSPSADDYAILSQDFLRLSTMIGMGRIAEVHAGLGTYLQVRPKAANARSVCYGLDEQGNKVLTLPRGFYLRVFATKQFLAKNPANDIR